MENNVITGLLAGLFCCLLISCSAYHPKPLTEQAIQQQQETPSAEQLSILATQIKHPYLQAIPFNIKDGLSPDEAAILAVLRNPELRAIRNRHGIAAAQLLQAGLLPNPRVSYNFAALTGGLTQGNGLVFLEDVAQVVKTRAPQWQRVTADGKDAVLFQIIQQPDGSTVDISKAFT